MRRLAALALFVVVAGCSPADPGIPFSPGKVTTPPAGGSGQTDSGQGAGDAGATGDGGNGADAGDGGSSDGGTTFSDGGIDGGVFVCDPRSATSSCPSNMYCGCNNPSGLGSNCFCYHGEANDPCASGGATCKAPGACRWYGGYFWGKCGTGAAGDVCSLGAFACNQNLTCVTGNCQWGACCE